MRKIIIAGPNGAGKTSLARLLSKKLSIPHTELDCLYWLSDWQPRSLEERKKIAAQILSTPTWIVGGNHFYLREITWDKADTVIWLDYPFWVCFWRVLKRGIRLIITKKEICGGNKETLTHFLFSRRSIFYYLFAKYRKLRRRYAAMMESPEWKHLTFIRLRSSRETKRWLYDVFGQHKSI